MPTPWSPLIWKEHKRREYEMDVCPHCGAEIRWIFDGISWLPCDREPVLFIIHPEGRENVVYRRKVIGRCLTYRKGDPRFAGAIPRQGNVQHYYTCPILKAARRDYARRNNR